MWQLYSQPLVRRNEPETQTHPSVRRYIQRRVELAVDQEKRCPWHIGQRIVEEGLSLQGTHAICDTHVTVGVFFAVLLDAFDVMFTAWFTASSTSSTSSIAVNRVELKKKTRECFFERPGMLVTVLARRLSLP